MITILPLAQNFGILLPFFKFVSLVSKNQPSEIFFLSLTRPHSQIYIRIYIIFKKTEPKITRKKAKELKKRREHMWKI